MRSGKMTKKKKKKKSRLIDFEADAGAGFENINEDGSDKFVQIRNMMGVARSIKTWKQFIYYAEEQNLQPSDALLFCYKGIKKSWNKFKILNDPDQLGAIVMLLDAEQKLGRKRLWVSEEFQQFCEWTGYKPKSESKYNNDMTMFREHLGLKRKHDGTYTRKQLAAAAAKALKKGFKGKR
jgi:hypothetical protein|tara:strand:- start:94 stop:633 length:540 start_codon:yes stop_codon:yes gene_type:complete